MVRTPPSKPEQLRAEAEGRLLDRTTPPSSGWTISPETLALLFRLASNPDSASDAQKLLHELQTHQVELDLQHAQLLENDHELNAQLSHYQALFEQAPAGYLVLDLHGRILHSNQATIEMLGLDTGRVDGRFLSRLLSPDSGPALSAMLEAPATAHRNQTIRVQTLSARRLRLMARSAALDEAILVMLFPDDSAEPI